MINCTIVGRLVADPVIREVMVNGTAQKVAHIRVAADEGRGDYRNTQFFNVSMWRGGADFAKDYLYQGRLVSVNGTVHIRSYITKSKQARTDMEFGANATVSVLDANKKAAEEGAEAPADEQTETPQETPETPASAPQTTEAKSNPDEDLPW